MTFNLKELITSLKNGLRARKAMFIPTGAVVTFMLVGYAAVDKEAPVINTKKVNLEYGKELNSRLFDITDNRDSEVEVKFVKGNLDNKQLGKYQVKVLATDSTGNTATKTVTVNVVDTKGPEIKISGGQGGYSVAVPINGSNDLASYIQAVDDVDGDVTAFITQSEALDTSYAHNQVIKVTATDSNGNTTTKEIEFVVADIEAPTLTLTNGSDVTVDLNSTFDVKNYLTVTDNIDTNVTLTTSDTIDTSKEGNIKTIDVTAKDASGNESKVTLNVTVKDISGPQINLTTSSISVNVGTTVDPASYLTGAIDNKDGDSKAKVTYNSIDTSTTGTKTITYTATDTTGNTSTASLTVEVKNPGQTVVDIAMTKLGCAYVWGATGPNTFDCSGLTSWVYKQLGITIPRTSSAQSQSGTYVDRSNLQVGDLVFFGGSTSSVHHVGIYIGNGMMIHAPTTGDVVKIASLQSNYVTARRYL